MADLNFPSNPNVGDTYTLGTRTWVWNGSGWQLQSGIVSTNPFIVVSAQVTTTTNSTSTTSGALIVAGGAGFGGDIYAGNIYANGSSVVTTATIGNFGVSTITAGTDTAVYIGAGNAYTIWNTSTLQTVTGRGATTNNAISITNTTDSSSTITGALKVSGGVGVGGNVYSGAHYWGNYSSNFVLVTKANGELTTDSGLQYTSTDSRLAVTGPVSVGGQLNAGNIFDNNNRVLTRITPTAGTAISITSVSTSNGNVTFTVNNEGVTSLNGTTYIGVSAVVGSITLTNLGVQTLTAGTDTAVSASTGTVIVWNTSTLQSVTGRGATTNNAISITNATGSSTSTGGALTVSGGVGVGENLNVGGNLQVWGRTTFANEVVFNGTATFVYSTNTYYTDNLLELHTTSTGVATQWTFDDGKDIGFKLYYYNRTLNTGTQAGLVLANDTQLLEFYSSGVENGSGDFVSATYGGFKTGLIQLTGTGAVGTDTSVANQSLTVTANGIGVSGASYFANNVGVGGRATLNSAVVTNNFTATGASTLNGAVTANSTLGVVGAFNVTGTSLLSGNVTAASNFGVIGNANITGTTTLVGQVNVVNTTQSSGVGNGSLVVSGGVGVAGNVNVGGNLFVQGVINATVVGSISTATNLTGGATGAIPYQTEFGKTSFFGPGTSGDLLVSRGGDPGAQPAFVNTLTLAGVVQSTNTLTGTLQVRGGVGIGLDVWVGGDIYTKNQQVITTATVNNWANQTAVFAGTDTAVSTSTGNITVWNISTLQTVTGRGATTTNAISIANTSDSTSTISGALTVAGGVGIAKELNVGGNANFAGASTIISNGTIYSLYVNGPATGLNVSSNANFTGVTTATNLKVTGAFTASGTATIPNITGNVYAGNNVGVQGQLAVTGTSVLSETTVTQNLTVVGTSTLANPVLIGPVAHYISFVSDTTTTNAKIYLDSFPVSDYQTAKYLVQIEDRGFTPRKVHVEEMLVFHDDNGTSTQVYLTSYAIAANQGELGAFDVEYLNGNVQLTFTPSPSPTQLLVKTVRTAIMS